MKKNEVRQLCDLLKIADQAYHEGGHIAEVFDLEEGEEREQEASGCGDALVLFIGREILSVYSPGDPIDDNRINVAKALETAIEELHAVRDAFITTIGKEVTRC